MHMILGFTWLLSVTDIISFTAVMAACVWVLLLLVKSYPTKVTLYSYSLLIAFGFAIASVFSHWQIIKFALNNNTNNAYYLNWFKSSLTIRYIVVVLFYSWMATNAALRKSISEQDARFTAQADSAEMLKEAELFKLRQQLQPHFLYNSLNSINALVMVDPDKAQEMVGKLSDFLRSSVKKESEDSVTIEEKLNYLESYLSIESVRFGDRLIVDIKKDITGTCKMPPFLLQPILENAIKFGLYGQTGQVKINVSISNKEHMLTIAVTNPYDPNLTPPKGTGFGLKGIERRLTLLFSRNDLLETIIDANEYTTILKIPQHQYA